MANATVAIGGIVGVVLAVPIIGSLLPPKNASGGSWAPLSAQELDALQKATSKPVKLTFTLKFVDGYLPEQSAAEYVWGIKVDPAKFQAARTDIFNQPTARPMFRTTSSTWVSSSSVRSVPHLGCYYGWNDAQNRFMCPCHGSQYTFDGTHIAGPAPRGLDPLPLREQSGTAEVTWIVYQSNTPSRIVVSYQA